MMKRHLGSTLAVVLAGLFFVVGVTNPKSGQLLMAFVTLFGALAYRSAKKRHLGEVKNTTTRVVIECVFIALITLAVVMQNDLRDQIAEHPAVNVLPLAWALIAYVVAIWPRKAQPREN